MALTESTMLALGTQAPDFELLNDEGNSVKLSNYQGKWVVLYFFPKAMTSG